MFNKIILLSSLMLINPLMSNVERNTFHQENSLEEKMVVQPETLEELRKADPLEIAELDKYDSRKYDIVTPVKKQFHDICWAYSTLAASETSILREGLFESATRSLDLDEVNHSYSTFNNDPSLDPLNLTNGDYFYDGNFDKGYTLTGSTQRLTTWVTPNFEPYIQDRPSLKSADFLLEDVIRVDFNDRNDIKRAIARYGAVTVVFKITDWHEEYYYYNGNVNVFDGDFHAVTIVGWDDTIDKNLYKLPSKMNGGWIVKNSWGNAHAEGDGYFAMSYDTPISDTYAFDYASKDKYDYNYHYDNSTTRDSFLNADKAAVIFPAKKSSLTKEEMLKAINVTIVDVESPKSVGEATIQADIYIDVNGDESDIYSSNNNPINKNGPVATITRKIDHEGTYTLELPEEVPLTNGRYFSVVVSITSPTNKYKVALATEKPSSNNDLTFYENEQGKWENCGTPTFRQVARIKAFTKTKERLTPADKDLRYAFVKVNESFRPRYNAIPKDINFEVSSENEILNKGIDYIIEPPEVTIKPELIEVTSDDDIVASGSIKIKGIGNWKGEKIIHFPVLVGFHDLSKFGEILVDNTVKITVDGSCLKYSDIPLDENWEFVFKDSELKIGENTGNYISYKGKDEICFRRNMYPVIVIKNDKVEPKVDITNAIFSLNNDTFIYNGNPHQPLVDVKLEGKSLAINRDFRIEYKNNINVGEAEIKIVGIGKYQGEKVLRFNISQANINSCVTSFNEETFYNGKEITPEITIELTGYHLVLNKDFKIVYSDNVNVGKGKIKIIGINNFKGEMLKEFAINKAKNEIIKFEIINNEPNAEAKFGQAYYKYYSDKECFKEIDKPTEPGLYYVKAFVDGNSNYENVSSGPLEIIVESNEKPTEPEPPTETPEEENKDNTNAIIIVSVVTPLVAIPAIVGLILLIKRKIK